MAIECCIGCGAAFDRIEGPTHAYMLSSPACWAAFGIVLAREYENQALFTAVHRMTVDAYAVQHPGSADDMRANQSVWIHLASLYLVLDEGRSFAEAKAAMARLTHLAFDPPSPPITPFSITVADVALADSSAHIATVKAWARSAYDGWEHLHEPVRKLFAGR